MKTNLDLGMALHGIALHGIGKTGSFCLKNKSGIVVKGIIDDNKMKEQIFLFLMVPL